jgi:hypothetical protein
MTWAGARRQADGTGAVGWRVHCTGFPEGSCLAIISSTKPSGLCYYCERSKAIAGTPKLTCDYPMGNKKFCGLPILHLGNRWDGGHKAAEPLSQAERDARRKRRTYGPVRKRTT